MKVILTYLLIFLTSFAIAQQKIVQALWQQQANYKIEVILNDDSSYLFGFETIEYINNSPDVLKEIYLHLYPNAYKNNTTAFAKEKIAKKDTKFWMAEEKDRGFINNLNFKTEALSIPLQYSNTSSDNAKLILPKPLAPGQRITITTTFNVKIPYTFSRLGHVGQSYQISQWFPKIAVYDINGWNQIPYLDQGEFYSDYGNYEVSITLPKNYLVAATGNLQDETEINWLKERANSHRRQPEEFEKNETKTLHFTENNIHDFAFFADKRWCVAIKDIHLPSGRKVTAYAFDTLYRNADQGLKYIEKAIVYLSQNVGEYPYQTVKSCTGAMQAGAGMEYPTVTIVGQQHEAEVVHEVAHNWFYGILGSNERRYAWMDEGITTFYELQICTEKEENQLSKIIQRITGNDFTYNNTNLVWLLGKINSSRAEDAPLNLPANEYSGTNYAALIYYRTALNFNYLKKYLGQELFDSCMKNYYALWHHRHPLPGDMKKSFVLVSEKNLDWFFDGMLTETQNYDLAIRKIIKEDKNQELEIHLRNKSGKAIAVPMRLTNEFLTHTIWIEPFENDTTIHVHNLHYTKVELNDSSYYVETNMNNNTYFLTKTIHRGWLPQLRLGIGLENKYHRTIFITPIMAYNKFNKQMFGIALFNSTIIRKKMEYVIVPLYSAEKKNLNGYANFSFTVMPRGKKVNTLNIGVKNAKFNSHILADGQVYADSPIYAFLPIQSYISGVYTRLQPFIQVNFTPPSNASRTLRFLRIDYTQISKTRALTSDSSFQNGSNAYLNFQYRMERKTLLNPYMINLWMEKNVKDKTNDYFKLGLKAQYKLSYDNPKKKLTIDLFVGRTFYSGKDNSGYYNFALADENPLFDYKYWNTSLNRDPGLQSTQILDEQGGVRSNIMSFSTSKLGATMRLRSHLAFTNLIRPYLDFGTYNGIYTDHGIKFFYTSGISLVLLDDIIEINFPLAITHSFEVAGNKQTEVNKSFRFAQSNVINEAIAVNSYRYLQTITVLLNLDKLNPSFWMRNIPLGE